MFTGIRETSVEETTLNWVLKEEWMAGKHKMAWHIWGPASSSVGQGSSETGETGQMRGWVVRSFNNPGKESP